MSNEKKYDLAFEAGWLAAGGEPLSRSVKTDKYAFLRALIDHSK